jgi:hypothetical protein
LPEATALAPAAAKKQVSFLAVANISSSVLRVFLIHRFTSFEHQVSSEQ